jgi:hypothetical protein
MYNEESSETECRFKCEKDSHWENSQCVFNTKTDVECTGLPQNATWNTASSITQTWNGSSWQPSNVGVYNEMASTEECCFKCDADSHWENNQCVSNTKTDVECIGLPKHASWNSVASITQTWDGSSWQPSNAGVYNETASTEECCFRCDTDYHVENNQCVSNIKTSDCSSKPANTIWNDNGANGKFTQNWTDSGWEPESYTSTYNETAGICRYVCNSWYLSNGDQCVTTLGRICTGQDKCYDNSTTITCPAVGADFFGQDAQYAVSGSCSPHSFTIIETDIENENIVLDNNTGLQWQQTMPSSTYTWDNAVSYCDGLTYAEYSDWRLPTPQEFLTIVDNSRYDPGIDTTYFPDTKSVFFWSSYAYFFDTRSAWRVDFDDDSVGLNDKKSSSSVRCVRGTAFPTSSFDSSTINGDVMVTDTETGLVWQKSYVSDKTWQQALSYCENLTYAGYSDWRLPNKNELTSLVNYEKYNPVSDFPDMPSEDFWSSSTNVGKADKPWYVNFNRGEVLYYSKTYNNYVRCVRGSKH